MKGKKIVRWIFRFCSASKDLKDLLRVLLDFEIKGKKSLHAMKIATAKTNSLESLEIIQLIANQSSFVKDLSNCKLITRVEFLGDR